MRGDNLSHAAARAAFENMLWLRGSVNDLADRFLPYLARTHQGLPVVTVTRAAVLAAITAYQSGTLTGPDLRAWAIIVHDAIIVGGGRAPYLGLEHRSRLNVHFALDLLIEHGPDHYTPQNLALIARNLSYTDLGFLARLQAVRFSLEVAAMGLWALVVGPCLAVRFLEGALSSLTVSTLGAYVISIALARWLSGPAAAIARLQLYWPAAVLGIAVLGAAEALGIAP